jgi:hypothetical protein
MEGDSELEKLFNEWKIEEEENIQYIHNRNKLLHQFNTIVNSYNMMPHNIADNCEDNIISFPNTIVTKIYYFMTLLYAISLKYIIFNNKEQDPYIIIVYHYIMFISMVYSRLLYRNINIKLLSSLLKKIN